jgi:photosystem II stability/assembly factor-like uncharacterized protein
MDCKASAMPRSDVKGDSIGILEIHAVSQPRNSRFLCTPTAVVLTAAFMVLVGASCAYGDTAVAAPSWEPVGLSGGGGMYTPAISPADPDLMMVNCDMSGAYISEDGGRNWRMIHHAQLRTDTRCRPAFHPTDPNVIYASSGGRLRLSRDRGRTFKPLGSLRKRLDGEIAINPANPRLVLAGTRGGPCVISRDGGVTWAECRGPEGRLIGFHFDRTRRGSTMFAATDRGVWRSDDAGGTWVEKTTGLPWKEIQAFARSMPACSGRASINRRTTGRRGRSSGTAWGIRRTGESVA